MIRTMNSLSTPARRRYLQSSGFRNDVLIGMADGMLLPFALAAALSFMTTRTGLIALVTGAESLMLAFFFGVAAYQTVVNQAQEYPGPDAARRRKGFVPHLQHIQILRHLDMGPEILEQAKRDGAAYEARWNDMLKTYGLGIVEPDYAKARSNGLTVALSFLLGAVLPVAPYLFMSDPVTALKYAAGLTFAGLLGFGIYKASYTGTAPWGAILRLLVTGAIIAVIVVAGAYLLRP